MERTILRLAKRASRIVTRFFDLVRVPSRRNRDQMVKNFRELIDDLNDLPIVK